LATREINTKEIIALHVTRGREIRECLTFLEKVKESGTSIDLILVVKGEDRRFHIDVGANYYLSPNHVKTILKEEKPFIFYVGATGLLGKFDEKLSNILQEAKMLGCTTFVDPIAPYKHGWDYLISSLKWIDIFHCNNIEALNMTGKENLEEAIEDLLKKGVNLVIVTMGENGLIARNKEVRIKMPAFKLQTINPTGAGDAFCAGVIYHIVQTMYHKKLKISEMSINELILTLLEGEAIGVACVTNVGTTTAVTRENVDRLLKEQGSIIMKNILISKVKF